MFKLQGSNSYKQYCKKPKKPKVLPKSCLDIRCKGVTDSGVYAIYPTGNQHGPLEVYCDQKTDGGGWTVSLLYLEHRMLKSERQEEL